MTAELLQDATVTVKAENIGGIDRTEVTLPPGVSVLTGRNATNRSSFLQALMAALGSTRASLKADADEGRVELQAGDETYDRTLTRAGDTVQFSGDPYLADAELADLFAFLLEDNQARRAVETNGDLHEVIMRPIDTAQLEQEIKSAERRKRELDEEIERLQGLEDELPRLRAERADLEEKLDQKEKDLDKVNSEIEEADIDIDEGKKKKEQLESVFDELREAESKLEDVEFEIETERSTIKELEEEREDIESGLSDDEFGGDDPEELDDRITELRGRKNSLDETISTLQSVIGFNEEMLEGDGKVAGKLLDETSGKGSQELTDQLLGDEKTTCWTCGSRVDPDRISRMLEQLQSLRAERLSERKEISNQIGELEDERRRIRQSKQKYERDRRRLEQVKDSLEQAHQRIEELEVTREELTEEVEGLQAKTEQFEGTDHTEILELHREANRLELEIDRIESNVEEVDERIEEYRDRIDELDQVRQRRTDVESELTELRTRIERIEADAVESFNEHIESILEILEYENIDRIWIERREEEVREGRRKVTRSTFEIHVVRSTDGVAYQDSLDHLSESEREVTGLVFALAGYLVHDVHQEVPIMVLDSLEAIDSGRIATLVEYFEDYVGHLVVALLPEDAQALDSGYTVIEEI